MIRPNQLTASQIEILRLADLRGGFKIIGLPEGRKPYHDLVEQGLLDDYQSTFSISKKGQEVLKHLDECQGISV